MLAKLATYLQGFTLKFWLIVIGALLAALAVQTVRLSIAQKDLAVMESNRAKAVAAAIYAARQADESANSQRQNDESKNHALDEKRRKAGMADGRRGANCERLRQAYPGADLPTCN